MAGLKEQDHWSSEAYQNAASYVPKLATKIVEWLNVQPDDHILDIGCGDGVLTYELALLINGTGNMTAIDSSASMIQSAQKSYSRPNLTYCNISAHSLPDAIFHGLKSNVNKIFSNAAMHWILRPEADRQEFFKRVHASLDANGIFVFEMGGMGNVGEMHAALMSATASRIGIRKAREADPWFFPDEKWMRDTLEKSNFVVEKLEMEHRPTPVTEGSGKDGRGVEGWVRLMGKQFLDAVEERKGNKEREECVKEVVGVLEEICEAPGGGKWIGYVRLRGLARKISL